jgi:hypothetical protein
MQRQSTLLASLPGPAAASATLPVACGVPLTSSAARAAANDSVERLGSYEACLAARRFRQRAVAYCVVRALRGLRKTVRAWKARQRADR